MTNCEIWQKSKTEKGYGQQWVDGKRWRAHRLAWFEAYGEIPAGFVIDHICHNEAAARGECAGGITCEHRACVNLEHLELVKQSANVSRGLWCIDVKQNCPKGHSYKDVRNIMVRKDGKRECAECNRIRAKASYARKQLVG